MSHILESFEGVRNFAWRSWTARSTSSIRVKLTGESATLLGGKIYVCQGKRVPSRNFNNRVFMLDYRAEEWQSRPLKPVLCTEEQTATLVGDVVYLLGGVDLGYSDIRPNSIIVQVFDPLLWECRLVQTFSELELSAGLSAHTSNYISSLNQIFVFGGETDDRGLSKLSDALLVFDMATATFTKPHTVGKPPRARSHHSSCASQSNLYVYGGKVRDRGPCFGDLQVLSIESRQLCWSRLKQSSPRFSASCSLVLGRIYILGGSSDIPFQEQLLVYEIHRNKWTTVRDNRSAMSQVSSFTVSGRMRGMLSHHSIYVDGRIVILGGRPGISGDTIPLEVVRELRSVPNTAGMKLNKKIMDII